MMGVPTFRYKLVAFALSCALAGVAGGIHALFVSYVTVGETFTITVPLTVVLMSVLGGTRHWAGPAVGAAVITGLLYAFTAGDHAVAGKAVVGAILVAGDPVHAGGHPGGFWCSAAPARAGAALAGGQRACRRRERKPASRRRQRAADGAGAATGKPLLRSARRCRKSFKGRAGARRRRPARCGAGRDPRAARTQRLGQVDVHQRGQRPLPAPARRDRLRGPRPRRPAGAPHRARRHRAHLPDPAPVRAPDGAGERRAGGDVRRARARRAARPSARPGSWLEFTGPAGARRMRCPTTSTCTSASSSSSRARSRRGRGWCCSTRCCRA